MNDFLKMNNDEILKENRGKKYDICLMNPPYDRSLHLKFLEKTIQIAENVVSIQPVRWLEEKVGKYKKNSAYNKYEESISKHIKDLEVIISEEAKKIFNILLPTNVGIYYCDENGGYDYKTLSENSIIEKVLEYIENNKCNFEYNKKDGYRVRVPFITGGKAVGSGNRPPTLTNIPLKNIVFKDGRYDGKWWYEYYMKNQYSKTTEEITSSIKFDSEKEGHNFVKSVKTDFCRYVESFLIVDVQINNKKILWMGNAKHPRTGEIGYKSEWTDEDFNEFFNLSDEEIKKYKAFIKDFEERRNKWLKEFNQKNKYRRE